VSLLGGLRSDRLIAKLMACSDMGSPDATRTIEKLQRIAPAAVPKMIEELASAGKHQTEMLVEGLATLADTKTLPAYLEGLASDNQRVASGVAWALASSKEFNPNRLLDVLTDEDVPTSAVIEILATHKERLDIRQVLTQAYALDTAEKAALFKIAADIVDDEVIPDLVARLGGKDVAARIHIMDILSKHDRRDVHQGLEDQLKSSNKLIRQAALTAIARTKARPNVELLANLLRDPDLDVQNKAVDALIRVNHPDTMRHLVEVLKDESEYTRRAAVEVLNEIGTPESIKDLLGALRDDDWWVRARATDALAKIGGPKVVDAVLQLVNDEDEEIRRSAIEILNTTGDERAVSTLIKATRDEDWWVRERAADALAELGDERALPALAQMLKGDARSIPSAVRALGKFGDQRLVKPILALMQRREKDIRLETLHAAVRLANEDNFEQIREAVQAAGQVDDDAVRQASAAAIRELEERFSPTSMAAAADAARFEEPERTLLVESSTPAVVSEPPSVQETLDITALEPGDVVDKRYKFLRKIGKGAFGTVLLMEDMVVEEPVVLKFLNPNVASDEEMMKRFVHELRYSRKITHRNVIRIYDFLYMQGLYAISMEYFNSHPLGEEIKDEQPMPLKLAVKYACDIATGMSVAHQAGIVHRDLKPANILIDKEGLLKIVDFGVAAARSSGDTQLTKTGYVIGSPKYMAPEQILGKKVDEKADIYSLGVILYEMLTGIPPYSRGDHMAVMYQHVQGKAARARDVNKDLPESVSDAVAKCMAVDKNKRYDSMDELRSVFGRFLAAGG
jgi:serine/threonine-protein kinase